MWAKLVVGGASAINAMDAIRDIGRLLASDSPSLDLLTVFSKTSSVIYDDTPSGWTYVGGNVAADQPTISATSVGAVGLTATNLAFSAPMKDDPSLLKYAVLTVASLTTTTSVYFGISLTGATGASTTGVITNEGARLTSGTQTAFIPTNINVIGGRTIHIIATPRHITIITEGIGMGAIWETTMTEAHKFYNIPAFVQFQDFLSSDTRVSNRTAPAAVSTNVYPVAFGNVFGVTDVNTGAYYGVYAVTGNGPSNITTTGVRHFDFNQGNLFQITPIKNTINYLGSLQYQVKPIYVHVPDLGYPVQYISGLIPIYWAAPNMGSTGDTVTISGTDYVYFNCGTGFGIVLKP